MSSFEGSSNGNGKHHGNEEELPDLEYQFEAEDDEEHEHEHTFINIAQTPTLSAYEEEIHGVITLEFRDRGLTMDFSLEEAQELGQVLAAVMTHLKGKQTSESDS